MPLPPVGPLLKTVKPEGSLKTWKPPSSPCEIRPRTTAWLSRTWTKSYAGDTGPLPEKYPSRNDPTPSSPAASMHESRFDIVATTGEGTAAGISPAHSSAGGGGGGCASNVAVAVWSFDICTTQAPAGTGSGRHS